MYVRVYFKCKLAFSQINNGAFEFDGEDFDPVLYKFAENEQELPIVRKNAARKQKGAKESKKQQKGKVADMGEQTKDKTPRAKQPQPRKESEETISQEELDSIVGNTLNNWVSFTKFGQCFSNWK